MNAGERPWAGAFMVPILQRLAPRLGARVVFEPQCGIAGRIEFPNGRQSYFWHNRFNLNSVASARISQDKGYATFFLGERGFRVPRSGVFFQDAYRDRIRCGKGTAEARLFASELEWDVYLKPLRGSQGNGILKSCTEREYDDAAELIFGREKKVQVQQACGGRDYRMVVLDGEVISAYERVTLSVCGDGVRTVDELLAAKQVDFDTTGRDTVLRSNDPRISLTLDRKGLKAGDVLLNGSTERLLDVANLSCGGTTLVVTDQVHPTVRVLVAEVCKALDLRFAGVDVLIPDATVALEDYHVLEVNSAPGLDHYADHGPEHDAEIDGLYFKVLEAIERGAA